MKTYALRSRSTFLVSHIIFLALTACADADAPSASSSATSSKQVGNVVNTSSRTGVTKTGTTPVAQAATTATTTNFGTAKTVTTSATPAPTPAPAVSAPAASSPAPAPAAPSPAPAAAAPSSTPPPVSPPAAPSASGGATVNSLDVVVADMRLRNDFVLRGFEDRTAGWAVGPGYNQMGNVANTNNTPTWWKSSNPSLLGIPMRAILPYVVLLDGTQNSASNTRVQMRNMKLYIKSKSTGQWALFGTSPGLGGFNTPKATLFAGSEQENKRVNGDGSIEIKPPSNVNLAWHGWWNLGRVAIEPNDVDAVYVTLDARLTVDNTGIADDTNQAELGLQVGSDYYSDTGSTWSSVNPAVALSRTKRITANWQSFNMMTFSDVGVQEPGGGISEASFRNAPPPL